MLCAFCKKRITKRKIEKIHGKPGTFIHTRCLIPWQCMQRLQGKQINGYPIHVTADYAKMEEPAAVVADYKTVSVTDMAIMTGRQFGKSSMYKAQIDYYAKLFGGK